MALHYDPDVVAEYFDLKKHRFNGDELQACCPFQHFKPEKGFYYENSPSFAINMYSGAWNCFSCDRRGLDLASLAFRLDRPIPTFFRSVDREEEEDKLEFEPKQYHLDVIKSNREIARLYLQGRDIHVDRKTMEEYHIGASREGDVIYFPIHTKDNEFIGWMERASDPSGHRWIMRPGGIDRSKAVYGAYQARHTVGIVVESTTDVIRLASWGYTAVGTCGASVMDEQIETILDLFNTVYIVPHNDEAGRNWALRLWGKMYYRCVMYGVRLPGIYGDVSDMPHLERPLFEKMLEQAVMLKSEPPKRRRPK